MSVKSLASGRKYTAQRFNSTGVTPYIYGTFINATALIVAGGGGGGNWNNAINNGGGGGAGGLYFANATITTGSGGNYSIIIGAGGAGGTGLTAAPNGSNTTAFGYSALGGGGGGSDSAGASGGSGGGGGGTVSVLKTGGSSTQSSTFGYGLGNAGANNAANAAGGAGGGGGAGAVGSTAGTGGAGVYSSISGSNTAYAGGGAGWGSGGAAATGGVGGGANSSGSTAIAGTTGTGGGGGGVNGLSTGGNGGSGVVIVNYPAPQYFTGGIVTNVNNLAGSNIVHTFLASGSLNALATPIDTYFPQTTLLLHGDGTVGANNTVFLDSSASPLTITTSGKPLQGTFSPFSQTGWSNYFNGSTDYLTTSSVGTAFGTSNFTVECWIFLTATPTTQYIIDARTSATSNWLLAWGNPSSGLLSWTTGSNLFQYNGTFNLNQWYHIAVVRTGTGSNQLTLYVNGVAVSTATDATNYTITGAYTIGNRFSGLAGTNFPGYISNLRVVSGTAVYTGNFTPSITPLTATGTTLALTCQDNRFKDNATSPLTLTLFGTPSVQPFSPFSPNTTYSNTSIGGSISFNGSSDYLSGTADPFGALTGNFTVEFWLYKNNAWSTGDQMIFDGGASTSMGVWVNTTAGTLRLSRSGVDAPIEYSYSTLTPNQWYHVAFSRSGTTLSMYVNGNRVNTVTSSASFAAGSTFNIGRNTSASQYWNGYISNFRAVKGSAVYDPTQTTITVPTAPATAVANTSLLLNATNAGIIDQTAKNAITTYGSAAISSTQSKFGGTSMYFDGSTGYLQMPGSMFNIGTSNFTVEAWIYPTALPGSQGLIFGTPWPSPGFQFFLNSTGTMQWQIYTAAAASSATVSINTWTHVAWVRNGSSNYIFINGTLSSTATDSTNVATPTAAYVGARGTDGINFTGYIDDVRFSRVARYTSSFTPPTSSFLDR